MMPRSLIAVCTWMGLLIAVGVPVVAQNRPPGGPPPAGPGQAPGGPPNGPGTNGPGPNNPGGNNPNSSAKAAAGSGHSSLQFGPVGRWWDDKSVVQAVGIGKAQQKRMDDVFNVSKPAILLSYKNFLSEQAKLDALNKDPKVDKATLFSAIDAVSQARASLQKTTSEMLLQIRKEMTPEQIERLEKLQ